MKKQLMAAATVAVCAGLIYGCGGGGGSTSSSTTSGSTLTAVSGKVADGYLVNAVVFMDKNNNYQLDPGEPSAVTDANGAYTLNVSAADVGKYPIVAMAIKGQTVDMDNPGTTVANSYVMSLPAAAVSGTVSAMVSPISSMIRENMAVNGKSLSDAMTQLRSQMNLPAGTNMMGDYVQLASTTTGSTQSAYQLMHSAAQDMATLMAGQSAQVMGNSGGTVTVDVNRMRTMMGEMNLQMPEMIQAMKAGAQQNQTMMGQMASTIGSMVSAVAPTVSGMPFRNMTGLFPSMSGTRFWNMTGHPIPYLQGMMGGTTSGSTSGTGGMMGGTSSGSTSGTGTTSTGTTSTGTGMMGN